MRNSGVQKTVLIVEDDTDNREVMTEIMTDLGYQVMAVSSAKEMLEHALSVDLIILDLSLPDLDGILALYKLRNTTSVPVIVCSARTTQADRVVSLRAGADDFIQKPYDIDELEARVDSVLRRAYTEKRKDKAGTLRVGSLVIDRTYVMCSIGDKPLYLSTLEFKLMYCLAERPNETVRYAEILEALFSRYLGDNSERGVQNIRVHINRIRRKLSTFPSAPKILTHLGVGYALVPD